MNPPRTRIVPTRRSQKALAVSLGSALEAASQYARASRAASTWRAYRADWEAFQSWCEAVGEQALPAEPHTVAIFSAAKAKSGKAPSTLTRRLAAIRLVRRGAKLASPHDAIEVSAGLQGVRRTWKKPPVQKAPALDEDVKRLADAALPETRKGLRDRALVLLGFAGAFRRPALVAIDDTECRPGSGWSYTYDFVRHAFGAGWRLEDHVEGLWRAVTDVCARHTLPEIVELPMQAIAGMFRALMLELLERDSPDLALPEEAVKSAIETIAFQQVQDHVILLASQKATAAAGPG